MKYTWYYGEKDHGGGICILFLIALFTPHNLTDVTEIYGT